MLEFVIAVLMAIGWWRECYQKWRRYVEAAS